MSARRSTFIRVDPRTVPRLSISIIRAVLPAPIRRELLDRAAGDDFVENGFLIAGFAKDAAQALDVLADLAGAGEDDRHVGLGDVHTLVEHLRRRDDRVGSAVEPDQDVPALLRLRLVGD